MIDALSSYIDHDISQRWITRPGEPEKDYKYENSQDNSKR